MTVDIAHAGLLYVRYNDSNRNHFLTRLKQWNYSIRDYLWDDTDYTFPIITVDPVNKVAFAANTTIMACLCSQGGKETPQEKALEFLTDYHESKEKTPS
jgi:hypothetical protein